MSGQGSSGEWEEAQLRAEAYVRAARGKFEAEERQLLADVLAAARARRRDAHPLRLVMSELFARLDLEQSDRNLCLQRPLNPSIERASMLPEPIEFPLLAALKKMSRARFLRTRIQQSLTLVSAGALLLAVFLFIR